MAIRQGAHRLSVQTQGKGLYDISAEVARCVAAEGIDTGLVTLWCRHTSASLTVQENASPDVRRDIAAFLDDLAPETRPYAHDDEGPDDMPAHLRSMLTDTSLAVPVMGGGLVLGTWQAIYLLEHRRAPHHREIVVHLLGE